MRKKGILIVGLALMIAAAGVVYAHWTETLTVDATVSTGDAYVRWVNIFTDDDTGNSIGEEIGLALPIWSSHTPVGSVDPASPGYPPADYPAFADRYDKDVAACWGGISDGQAPGLGYNMTVNATNVYPSYNCTIWSYFQNQGTIPMKVQSVNITYTADVMGTEVVWDTLKGTGCGLQIDPTEEMFTVNWFHILQGADQLDTYTLHQDIAFVNWNEWDPALCFKTVNGVQGPLALHTP